MARCLICRHCHAAHIDFCQDLYRSLDPALIPRRSSATATRRQFYFLHNESIVEETAR